MSSWDTALARCLAQVKEVATKFDSCFLGEGLWGTQRLGECHSEPFLVCCQGVSRGSWPAHGRSLKVKVGTIGLPFYLYDSRECVRRGGQILNVTLDFSQEFLFKIWSLLSENMLFSLSFMKCLNELLFQKLENLIFISLQAIWCGVMNHVQGIHQWEDFKCLHEMNPDGTYTPDPNCGEPKHPILPESPAWKALFAIVHNEQLVDSLKHYATFR